MEIAEGTVHLRRRATILGSQDRRTCRRNAMRVTSQRLRRMEIAVGIVRSRHRLAASPCRRAGATAVDTGTAQHPAPPRREGTTRLRVTMDAGPLVRSWI